MDGISHVLVVADEHHNDRSSLRRAARLARLAGARLTVVEVAPRTDLADLVRCEDADLVIRPAPSRPDEHDEIGLQLVRRCPAPVLLMRPTRARRLRILATVDPDPADPVRDRLNDRVLGLAAALARLEDADLHVVNVWDFPEETTLRTSAFARRPEAEVDAMVQQVEARRHELVDAVVCGVDLAGVRWDLHVVRGEPGPMIAELAERLDVNLVVVGTVGRSGLRALVMGNTAETVLRTVACSVLTVRPRPPDGLTRDRARLRSGDVRSGSAPARAMR